MLLSHLELSVNLPLLTVSELFVLALSWRFARLVSSTIALPQRSQGASAYGLRCVDTLHKGASEDDIVAHG